MRLSIELAARIAKGHRGRSPRGYELPEGLMHRAVMVQAGRATPEDGRKMAIRARAVESLPISSQTPIGMVKLHWFERRNVLGAFCTRPQVIEIGRIGRAGASSSRRAGSWGDAGGPIYGWAY